jgi:hypothetical protein
MADETKGEKGDTGATGETGEKGAKGEKGGPGVVVLPAKPDHIQEIEAEGKKKVNFLWEATQGAIAILIILADVIIFVAQTLRGGPSDFPDVLSNMSFVVLGFYFARTKPEPPYLAR